MKRSKRKITADKVREYRWRKRLKNMRKAIASMTGLGCTMKEATRALLALSTAMKSGKSALVHDTMYSKGFYKQAQHLHPPMPRRNGYCTIIKPKGDQR